MHLWAAPAYSIGRSKRSSSVKKLSGPGPSTYNNEKRNSSPSWKMTKASKSNYATIQTPGPGSYTMNFKNNAKQRGVSFKGRPSSAMNTYQTPGPGDYKPNISAIVKKSPEHKIPKNKRDSSHDQKKPGPTTYYTLTGENWKSGYKFGREDKLGSSYNTNPGPCTYQYGDRDLKLKRSAPRASFGSAQRIKSIRPDSPGRINQQYLAGSYSILGEFEGQGSSKKGYKMPKSAKGDLIPRRNSPGPGSYNLPTQTILKASPAYTISGGPMNSLLNYSSTPGPATYHISNALDSKLGGIINKSKKYDSPKNKNNPGPGKYNCQIQFGSLGPKYSIPQKHSNVNNQKNPGPADYSPNFNDNHVYSPIIKRQKESLNGSRIRESPGPGFYNPNSLSSISYSIGKEKRDMYKSEENPGPGQYDHQSTISNLQKYSIQSFNSRGAH